MQYTNRILSRSKPCGGIFLVTDAIEFALADYGLNAAAADVTVSCRPKPTQCLSRRGSVTITVAVSIPLPLVPPALTLDVPLSVPLEATATQRVSRFWGPERIGPES